MNFIDDRHLSLLGEKEEELLGKPRVVMSSDQMAVITRSELFALTIGIKTKVFPLSDIFMPCSSWCKCAHVMALQSSAHLKCQHEARGSEDMIKIHQGFLQWQSFADNS